MQELIYGIGFNDKTYAARSGGKQIRAYDIWQKMIYRCTEKFQDKYPTYTGTACSENFKHYTFFYEWCQKQVGFGNIDDNGKSWHLDKDILIKGNKLYSEDTCVFIPNRINTFLIKRDSKRGGMCIGVYKDRKGGFIAQCNNGTGRQVYLGRYRTEEKAFQAYRLFKENLAASLAMDYQLSIDKRAYSALLEYKVSSND